jgi:hypothetical protein
VLDKSRVGDPGTASFALTRSVRNDYLDPQYSRLAFEARQLWLDRQQRAGQRLLVDCGCLNLVKASVTPDVPASYAVRSFAVLEELQLRREALPGPALAERFPQFAADGGWLDVDAGFADVAAVTALLRSVGGAAGAVPDEPGDADDGVAARRRRGPRVPAGAGAVLVHPGRHGRLRRGGPHEPAICLFTCNSRTASRRRPRAQWCRRRWAGCQACAEVHRAAPRRHECSCQPAALRSRSQGPRG